MKKYIKIFATIAILFAACTHMEKSMNDTITEPVLKEEPKLIYPLSAQQNNWSGTTVVIFSINEEGKVDQTKVHNSSGYSALDKAAENYCKELVFIPATQNGQNIAASMKWEVEFNLKDLGKEIFAAITDVNDLYYEIENSSASEKQSLQKEILSHHNYVVKNTKDGIKFNEYMYAVIKDKLSKEWKTVSEFYPLTFLLYHDFLLRFPDYDSVSVVKSRLEQALKQDINYLLSSNNVGYEYKINKDVLLQKVKNLFKNEYPDINIEYIISDVESKNNIIS